MISFPERSGFFWIKLRMVEVTVSSVCLTLAGPWRSLSQPRFLALSEVPCPICDKHTNPKFSYLKSCPSSSAASPLTLTKPHTSRLYLVLDLAVRSLYFPSGILRLWSFLFLLFFLCEINPLILTPPVLYLKHWSIESQQSVLYLFPLFSFTQLWGTIFGLTVLLTAAIA